MTILDRLVQTAATRSASREQVLPFKELEKRLVQAPEPKRFIECLVAAKGIGLIAELKAASPSAGRIRHPFDVKKLAAELVSGGADCLSVLTEEEHFQGSLENLRRADVGVPRLQKDFLLSEYQVLEGRVAGADAILLIADILTPECAQRLSHFALSLGMDVLYEAHDAAPLQQVMQLAATQPDRILVGVNNRNLQNFAVDLQATVRALAGLPAPLRVVGESGIHTAEDVRLLRDAGVCAVLVGESLMRQADVAQAAQALLAGVRGD
jgi:indole-3-glycerol phosphate synthase